MRISQIAAMNSAYRNLYVNRTKANSSLEKLSSGYRINRAGDDAAGLAISEKMRGIIGGLTQASRNAQNSVSMVQTAEGALSSSSSVLTRMRELAVQASNGTYSDSDRALLDKEFQQLKSQLDQTANSTNYNGINLLDGTLGGSTGMDALTDLGINGITVGGAMDIDGTLKLNVTQDSGVYTITAQIGDQVYSEEINPLDTDVTFNFGGTSINVDFGSVANLEEGVLANVGIESGNAAANVSGARSSPTGDGLTFQIGANGSASDQTHLTIGDMSSVGLGLSGIDITTAAGANEALKAIDAATNQLNGERAGLGAMQNRLEHTISNLGVSRENMIASESSIRDLDMAHEIMLYTQRSIQMKASQAMMAQGMNISRQNMIGLLMR